MRFPPFVQLVDVIADGEKETELESFLTGVRANLISRVMTIRAIDVLGPVPARLMKAQGRYRWHILIKSRPGEAGLDGVREFLRSLSPPRGVALKIQVDP